MNSSLPISVHTDHTLFPDERHSILDSIDSVRNFGEVVFAESFLVGVERTVVCSSQIQISTATAKLTLRTKTDSDNGKYGSINQSWAWIGSIH